MKPLLAFILLLPAVALGETNYIYKNGSQYVDQETDMGNGVTYHHITENTNDVTNPGKTFTGYEYDHGNGQTETRISEQKPVVANDAEYWGNKMKETSKDSNPHWPF